MTFKKGGGHNPETWDGRRCRVCAIPVEYIQRTSRYRHKKGGGRDSGRGRDSRAVNSAGDAAPSRDESRSAANPAACPLRGCWMGTCLCPRPEFWNRIRALEAEVARLRQEAKA